jgi:predicted small metal-binding protein
MQKLACKDIGINTSCPFEATGDSAEETVDMAMEHVKRAHADEVSAMGLSDDDLRATATEKVRGDGGGEEKESEEEPETE